MFDKRKRPTVVETFYRCCRFLPMETIEEFTCPQCGRADIWRKTGETIQRIIVAIYACPHCSTEKKIQFAKPFFLLPKNWRFWRRRKRPY